MNAVTFAAWKSGVRGAMEQGNQLRRFDETFVLSNHVLFAVSAAKIAHNRYRKPVATIKVRM
ncbi:hypothetical protein A6M23_17530 [Acidithiobacillus thiooxidans]|jgi:hypothetical protein|uniref:Uncharacterized protein n=1 Tax=Acidithiobacillus thiooxidans TaxID=930 RepID=A0A1C2HY13_ACITH|nr:hypothetical protein A6M23_17530 [Acidithiobacillus thiooxidans]OCX80612.1 hypothetical protein A6P08_15845 [Acidithiobacillus thiooxidans]